MAIKKIQMIPPGYTDVVHPETAADNIIETDSKKVMTGDERTKLGNIPSDAVFTDTNTVTSINGKTGVIAKADITALGIPAQDTVVDISGKADKTYVDDKVKTDVPVGAKFTDTVYAHPTTAGNKHVPTGGTVGQVLVNSASGTGVWRTDEHTTRQINDGETHGIRLNLDKKMEYFNGTEWVEVKGGGYPVNIVKNIAVADEGDGLVGLTWQDPDDVVIDGVTVAKWKTTKVMRKVGEYPKHEEDGQVVVVSGVRNQYESTPFNDTGLVNNTEYYYSLFPITEDDVVTLSETQRVIGTPSEIKIYGVEIDESNSNPETSVTYTGDAVGFTPMRGNGGNFQWGSWETVFNNLEIKPCLLKNGVVNYYLNPNDYTLKATGGASDITSGNDGDVMIEFPKLYWKMEKVGSIQKVKFSREMFDGAKCPAHTVGSIEKEKIYLSAYLGNNLSSKLRSLSGKMPTAAQTIGAFRTQAQANGSGYQQATYYGLLMLQVLYTVFFKSIDSQTALGRGYVDGNSSAIATGATNKKGMFYGETTGKQQNKFCGIEDFWGNTYYWIDGFYSDANRNMMISKQDVFNDNGSGYANYGVGASADTSGYINSIQGGTDTGFVIKGKTGSDSTYYSDYSYLYNRSLPRFGGIWHYGSFAGAFPLQVSYSPSISHADIGGRLCFIGG